MIKCQKFKQNSIALSGNMNSKKLFNGRLEKQLISQLIYSVTHQILMISLMITKTDLRAHSYLVSSI